MCAYVYFCASFIALVKWYPGLDCNIKDLPTVLILIVVDDILLDLMCCPYTYKRL